MLFFFIIIFCHDIWVGTSHVPIGYHDKKFLKAMCTSMGVSLSKIGFRFEVYV